MTDFKKGDIVVGTQRRKNGTERTVRGQVVDVTPTRLKVQYQRTSTRSSSFSWGAHETWVKKADAKKVGHKKHNVAQKCGRALMEMLREGHKARGEI